MTYRQAIECEFAFHNMRVKRIMFRAAMGAARALPVGDGARDICRDDARDYLRDYRKHRATYRAMIGA